MLDRRDRREVVSTFAVADDQVRRDHMISHLLHAIASLEALRGLGLVFFGGTALARTVLVDGRLSEDIDLYASDRPAAARVIKQHLGRAVRHEFPDLRWISTFRGSRELDAAILDDGSGTVVRIQLLRTDDTCRRWPTEVRTLHERYSDVETTSLVVPTRPAFVAMKAAAWRDRRAARDLFDLHGLAERGAIDEAARDLLADVTGIGVERTDYASLPTDFAWEQQLAHQTGRLPDADHCLRHVRVAWSEVCGW